MSVTLPKRYQAENFQTGQAADQLLEYTHTITKNTNYFPKSERLLLAHDIRKLAMEICDLVWTANDVPTDSRMDFERRLRIQQKAYEDLLSMLRRARLDHRIKEYYRIKHYVRYMDDMLFVSSDLDELRTVRSAVTDELAALGYMVSQKKTHIQPLSQGIHYLGFSFRLCSGGNISRRILPSAIGRARRRMKKHAAYVASGKVSYAYAESCYTAWKAHAAKGDTKPLIKQMDAYFESLYSDWRSEDESNDRSGHGC